MYSETPDIIPFPTSFKGKVLTQAELETLKGGTLRLLDEVGVHFPSRRTWCKRQCLPRRALLCWAGARSALTCCWTGTVPT